MGPYSTLQLTVGQAHTVLFDQPLLAARDPDGDGNGRSTGGGTPADLTDGDAGGAVTNLLDSLPWLKPLLSAIGAVLALWMVVKFIMDKSKGQQGGAGGRIGQVAGGILGLALFFDPSLIATMFDWILTVVQSFFTWLGGVFGGSSS